MLRRTRRVALSLTVVFLFLLGLVGPAAAQVELSVLSPWAVTTEKTQEFPMAPRLSSLEGVSIGVLNNTKPGADKMEPYLLEELKKVAPSTTFVNVRISYNDYSEKAKDLRNLANRVKGVITFVGD